jgi:predicted RNase H-like HicB family nuclease
MKGPQDAKYEIYATGLTDAAVRAAQLASAAELRKDLEEAMKMHQQASDLYKEQGEELVKTYK